MPYVELEHTADILIRVREKTLDSLFAESARAMFACMFPDRKAGESSFTFTVEGNDYESLLHEFLSELLFLSEVNRTVFTDVTVDISGTTLSATATGEPFNEERHRGGTEIKGVSYFGMQIVKDNGEYQVDILFDV